MRKDIFTRLRVMIASFNKDEMEEFDAAATPTGIRRWSRQSKTLLLAITAAMGIVAVALVLFLLLTRH